MSKERAKGTKWESALVAFLREHGFPWADRVPMSGAKDRGDVTIGPGSPVIEAKNYSRVDEHGRQRLHWGQWMDEAAQEAVNAGAPFGVVWAKRRGKSSPGDAYVMMTGHTYVQLLTAAGFAAPTTVRNGDLHND